MQKILISFLCFEFDVAAVFHVKKIDALWRFNLYFSFVIHSEKKEKLPQFRKYKIDANVELYNILTVL